jgi:gliding motility-associated-like protein
MKKILSFLLYVSGLVFLIVPSARCAGTTAITGTLTGSNTCNGAPGLLTFHSQAGPGPFTLRYTDGTTTYSAAGVMDGEPFKVQVQPTVSTIYTLLSIQNAAGVLITADPGITAVINPGLCTLCTGSLGDPIINATFGSGNGNSPPLELVIPGASTNLTYQPTSGVPARPTPLDGFYTISSTVPVNSSGAYWHTAGRDHTGDPNGYMLYENPGTSTGEFFRQKMTTLCGGGKYEFSAWIAESDDPRTVPNPVLPDLTFIVQTEDGTVLDTYNSGPVPELATWTWNQYGFNFTLPPGVTTAIVRILDNNPGGFAVAGNDFAIDDITFRPCGPVMTAGLAVGQPPLVCPGAQAIFTGAVTGGYAAPAYLWQVSADTGKTWADIPNSNNTQLTATAATTTSAVAYQYRMLAAEASNIQSPGCRVASNTVVLVVSAGPSTDFSFTQQACNPLEVQFTGTATAGATYTWNIDGTDYAPAGAGDPSLVHIFPDYGNYTVTLKGAFTCPGSTVKTISLALTPAEIVVTPDTNICAGKPVNLRARPALSWCWSPTAGLDDATLANPVATPAVTTKYHYTALVVGANLLFNGDFSGGNAGFVSDYTYTTNSFSERVYGIGPNAAVWLLNAPACGDHTSGSGNMLLVNGAPQAGVRVWSQTVVVQPNTNYAFSAWLENITTLNPAVLQFAINGQLLGSALTANVNDCVWDQFHTVWNSGAATTAVISIVNANTAPSGNDFALDDLSFAPVTLLTDSVTIDVETPAVTAIPAVASVCPGVPQGMQAGGSLKYSWSPATGLDDPDAGSPLFILPASSVPQTILYTLTGTSARGCVATATAAMTRLPALIFAGPSNVVVCEDNPVQLFSGGGNSYSWSPATLLDDPASQNPTATVATTTKFYLSIQDVNRCTETDSLVIAVRPKPVYAAPPDKTICYGFDVKLTSSNGPGYVYAWTPAEGLDDASASVPDARPLATTDYLLQISDSVCAAYDSVFTVQVIVRPSPAIAAEKDNDIDCAVHTAQLRVNGGLYYSWTPVSGLSDSRSAAPIASVDTTTTYVVKGTGSNGCFAYDTVTVNVTATGANTFMVPNAFTPNGDGHNDCFGVSRWGDVRLEELVIYNRLGLRVFTTRNPSECWDGSFRGQLQEAGAYAYVIKAHTFCGAITRMGTVMLVR